MGTSWYSDFGKMITMNGMLIIFRMLVKIGKEKRHGGGDNTYIQQDCKASKIKVDKNVEVKYFGKR